MTRKKHMKLITSCILMLLFNLKTYSQIALPDSSADNSERSWSARVSGFIQTDAMLDFQEMAFKDGFIAPSIVNPQMNSSGTNFSIKQSQLRLNIKKKSPSSANPDISGYLEIDFLGPNGTTAPRFRQGYIQWKKLLIGQTWSNFSDFDIFPNIFDFAGPNGTMFVRTIQIRYSTPVSRKGNLSLALEDPDATSVLLPDNAPNWKKKSVLPIFTAVYRYGNLRDYGKIGGILSPVNYEIKNDHQPASSNTILGFGGMISGRIYSSTLNNFRFQSSFGRGYSNYNGVLTGEKYDAVPDLEKNKLTALPLFNILGIYEHWWTPKWSSVIYYSYSRLGKKDFVPGTMIQTFENSGINLIYQPYKILRIGMEGNYGKVKNFDRQRAKAFRLQFSSSFSF